ncbi:LytTR family transcriptional regulator [Spirosoma sp. BT702]|uniref:LytTR family transcriptional regulator n=1 Tax=Spirosoma profusum TaxID=2771354 RepID=A0A927AQ74_9BACT|nr:LytTR family DNA-binding domain-containing protein [Spirosoma profusum]MBD2699776.1 LytTR family transcriptional regulator [Spirosoma profusum]
MDTIQLPHFTTKRSIPIAAIEYLEAMGNYTTLYVVGQKPLLVAITLKRLEERLPNFLRIHKGTLVNPAHIIAYRYRYVESPFVELSESRQLSISRRQTRRLRPQLASHNRALAALPIA